MRVDDSKIQLRLVQKPGNFRAEMSDGAVCMRGSPIQVTALCRVSPDTPVPVTPSAAVCRSDPRLAPWKLGFMQVQILETLWAYYRGAQNDHGCVLNDWSAQRELQICRDYKRSLGTVWYEGSNHVYDCYGLPDTSKPAPWNLEFYFGDNPKTDVPAKVLNPRTQRYNYLNEARWAVAFVTTLTEQVSSGVFKHHRHFFWSGIWHVQARNPATHGENGTFKLLPGSGFWISPFKRGAPMDSRYVAALNSPALTHSCNEIVQDASAAKSVASDWQRFPLMERRDALFL